MRFPTKNKILTILTIIIWGFFMIGSVIAIKNYFHRRKQETIKLMNKNDAPLFEVNRINDHNEDKILIPIPMPNLNPSKYTHNVTINHQATLNKNGFDIDVPLFLKITTKYDTENTFSHPDRYFNLEIKSNNTIHDETQRPRMVLNDEGIGKINIQISLQQHQFISVQNPILNLILDYELVDKNGNALGGGTQTITNPIANIA
ncbi:MAG: hypothetical protein Q8770_02330 [Sweet potato little leaf phytoplasma]|nr:hypothetical protein [Sweet potato little leaf phytoplasma]